MTDENPRIFRTLERSIGREEFDAIVRAAVVSYAALKRPTEAQAREFGRLVAPFFLKVTTETRRVVAASLSTSPRLPRDVVELLLNEPIEVSAPFLLSSPALLPNDLANLADRREREVKTILTRRREGAAAPAPKASKRGRSKPAASRKTKVGASPGETAPSLNNGRQMALLTATTSETAFADSTNGSRKPEATESSSVSDVRETLRRLASVGRQPAVAQTSEPADLLAAAVADDPDGFDRLLRRQLNLSPSAAKSIRADATGQQMAVALAALEIGYADALTILMMMIPEIGRDVAAFEAMTARYRSLDATECAARFGAKRSTAVKAKHKPQYEPSNIAPRTDQRAVFGRRKAAPKLAREA